MTRRVLASLALALAVLLSPAAASAALVGVVDLGANEWEVTLNGEAGDVPTFVESIDIHGIIISGATLVSHDASSSIFVGKVLGPLNIIIDATTFHVGASTLDTDVPFDDGSSLPLGRFTLDGAPSEISLGGSGFYQVSAHLGYPNITLNASFGDVLYPAAAPEPGALGLLTLALPGLGAARRGRGRACAADGRAEAPPAG